jgi:aryl-alcohol dehydrogenase-like predicted oxidoreductase
MQTVELGRTGRRVSRIGMGALPLSFDGRPPREAALRVVWRALELGITFFDTADSYCLHAGEVGHNERLLREALGAHPAGAGALVATKGGIARDGRRMRIDAHPASLRRACHASRAALGVDAIELYQLHAPDPRVPFADSVGALAGLVAEGAVLRVGLSNVSRAQLDEARMVVEVASVQNHFNPWDRSDQRSGLVDACAAEGITFLPHSPLGGARRVARLAESPRLAALARAHGATAPELVLAWLLARWPAMLPIPGASRPESVEGAARAAALRLDAEALAALEEAFAALPGASAPTPAAAGA